MFIILKLIINLNILGILYLGILLTHITQKIINMHSVIFSLKESDVGARNSLTCDWFAAGFTLLSVQVAETFEAVWAVITGSEMLAS